MKTLRIALFFILVIMMTFHSFAQDVKKEKKAILNLEIVDANGNKHVIDTTFTIAPDQKYSEIIEKIKEKAGFSKEEIAAMKSEFQANAKQMKMDIQVLMEGMHKDTMHDHMMMVREKMNEGKEDLKQALEELKVELGKIDMNKEAMQKLENAMRKLKEIDWRAKENQMDNLNDYFDKDVNVFFIDSDSLHHQVWINKDDKNIKYKKFQKDGNVIFFGDEADLEKIEAFDDGGQRVIIKKLRGEADKGNAIFITDDKQVIKEFKDQDGNVKEMRYKIKSGDGNDNEIEVFMVAKGNHSKEYHKKMMISPANAEEMEFATTKQLINPKAKALVLNEFTLNMDNEITTVGAVFDKKGKLMLQIFDNEMNKLWEKDAGKVKGEWSTEIPSDVLKEKGTYFFNFTQGKKAKLLKMVISFLSLNTH